VQLWLRQAHSAPDGVCIRLLGRVFHKALRDARAMQADCAIHGRSVDHRQRVCNLLHTTCQTDKARSTRSASEDVQCLCKAWTLCLGIFHVSLKATVHFHIHRAHPILRLKLSVRIALTMGVLLFYLAGEKPESGVELDIHQISDLAALQNLIAQQFGIVVPSEVGFQRKEAVIEELSEIQNSSDPVSVTVSGHAVRDVPGPEGLPVVGNYFEGTTETAISG
jgi:hypothetical protein